MSIIDSINERLNTEELLTFIPGLTKQGHNYVGKCPTGHDSKSGLSFQVNTLDPTFHCFNCGVSGSYIHLVELIKFNQCSAGNGGTESFRETLKFLANKYEISGESGSYTKKDSVLELLELIIAEYSNQFNEYGDGLMESIVRKYGLTKEFIKSEKWGYGHKCPSKSFREFFSIEELLATGMFNKSEKSSTGLFHIMQDRVVMPYNILGRSVYSIGRKTKKTKKWPPASPGGEWREAPKYFKQYVNNENHPYVSEFIQNEIVRCNKDNEEVVITEGITDFLAAKMHGINSVSAVTTSFKKKEYEKVASFCKRFRLVYIANDNDENEAGQKGTKRICEMLINAGINPYVILLPKPDSKNKIDLSEFLRDKGKDAFDLLKSAAPTYIDYLIDMVNPNEDKANLMVKLNDVFKALSNTTPDIIDIYLYDKIKTRFKLASMKNVLKAMKNKIDEYTGTLPIDRELKEKSKDSIFKDNSNDISMISSGQDYKDGILYYTITRPSQVTDKNGIIRIVNTPFLVTSNKKILEIKDYQIISDGFALNRKLSPEVRLESWTFKDSKYSVESYVSGKVNIDPSVLYLKIRALFKDYLYFQNDYEYNMASVFIMTCPMYMIFNAIGYIHLWAEKRSGKTTFLEILRLIGFNAMLSSSMTDAAIFRSIEIYRPLLLMDEAENLNPSMKARDNNPSEKLELLKSGYKKSGTATRCEGQSNTVMTFHNYGPKVLAGTKSIDAVLGDRSITWAMKRAPESTGIKELIEIKVLPTTNEIRDMVYCYSMEHSKDIEKIYLNELDENRDRLSEHKVTFRDRELWAPYLCTALLIDKYNSSLNVFGSLLKMASDGIATKEAFGGDSKSIEIIEQLYLWTKRVQEGTITEMSLLYEGNVYLRSGITDNFIKYVLKSEENEDDFSYVNYQNLKQTLRKFHVIDKDCDLKGYRIGLKRGAALVLDKERMIKSLMTYKNEFDEDVLLDIQEFKNKEGSENVKKIMEEEMD